MATIREIKHMLTRARSTDDALERGRMMLAVQRMAPQSRASDAHEIEYWGHLGAVLAARRYKGADPATKAELGRIRAESQYLINGLC